MSLEAEIANTGMITIRRAEYDKLVKDADWLRCLEMAGVDNWIGMDHAADMKREYYPEYNEE